MCMWFDMKWCECVQTSAQMCTYLVRQMTMTDVSVFVRGCVWNKSSICVCMIEKCRADTGTQWRHFEFHPSLHHCLLPSFSPRFLKAQTLPVVTLEYYRPAEALHSFGRRMSDQARGSFDKQSIYWYMIKYARNHPTAEGYYSFNIIIWINKHSVEK